MNAHARKASRTKAREGSPGGRRYLSEAGLARYGRDARPAFEHAKQGEEIEKNAHEAISEPTEVSETENKPEEPEVKIPNAAKRARKKIEK